MIAVGTHGRVCSCHDLTVATDSNRETSTSGLGPFSCLHIQKVLHFPKCSADGFREASAPPRAPKCRNPAGRPQGRGRHPCNCRNFWTLLSSSRVTSVNSHRDGAHGSPSHAGSYRVRKPWIRSQNKQLKQTGHTRRHQTVFSYCQGSVSRNAACLGRLLE